MCGILRENCDYSRKISATKEIAYDDESANNGIYMSQRNLFLFICNKMLGGHYNHLPSILVTWL